MDTVGTCFFDGEGTVGLHFFNGMGADGLCFLDGLSGFRLVMLKSHTKFGNKLLPMGINCGLGC